MNNFWLGICLVIVGMLFAYLILKTILWKEFREVKGGEKRWKLFLRALQYPDISSAGYFLLSIILIVFGLLLIFL